MHTSASRRWLELTQSPAEAEAELVEQTRRTGAAWARTGARVNTVVDTPSLSVPTQSRQAQTGALKTRPRTAATAAMHDVASVVLFLASSGANALSGQTLHVSSGLRG